MSKKVGWQTKRNNGIKVTLPSGDEVSLRVVWDAATGMDVAYIVPRGDGDNGNRNAQLIHVLPVLLMACVNVVKIAEERGGEVPAELAEAISHIKTVVGIACDGPHPDVVIADLFAIKAATG